MKAGELVPDDLIVAMAGERLDEEDARDGFILDGFPRTLEQAGALKQQLAKMGRRVTAALLIDTPDEEVVRRLSGRRVCVKSGHLYHVEFDPPKHDEVCDQDGSRLIRRDDDDPEVVRNRCACTTSRPSRWWSTTTSEGIMRRIDGTRDAGRCPRPHPRRDRDAAARGQLLGSAAGRVRSVRRDHQEDPRRDRPDGRRRHDPGQDAESARRQGPPRRDHARARRGRREVHPLPGRRAGVQGLPRVPGLDLRLAELDDRPRDPRATTSSRAETSCRWTSASCSTAGLRTRRGRSRSARSRRSPESC